MAIKNVAEAGVPPHPPFPLKPGLLLQTAGPGYAGPEYAAGVSGNLSLQEDEYSLACTKVRMRHAHPKNAPESEREGAGQITRI